MSPSRYPAAKMFSFRNRNSEFSTENPGDFVVTCTRPRFIQFFNPNGYHGEIGGREKNFFREKLRPLHFTTEPSCIDRILLPALWRSFLWLDLPRACLVYELAQMAIDAPFMGTNMPSPPVDSSDRGGTQRSNRTQTACRQPND